MKAGNQCVFFLFQLCNGLVLLAALGLAALGLWLWIDTGAFSFIDILFIGAGGFELLLALVGLCSEKSLAGIRLYYYGLWLVFLGQLVITVLGFSLHDKIANWIAEKTHSEADIAVLKDKIWVLAYYALATLVIFVLTLVLASCYKSSLKDRNTDYRYKVFDEDLGKISLQEKREKDDITARDNANERREDLYSKHPRFREWKERRAQD
jgi:hypothetical protein